MEESFKALILFLICSSVTAERFSSRCPFRFKFDRDTNRCVKVQNGISYIDRYPNCERSHEGPGTTWVDTYELYENGPLAAYNGTDLNLVHLLTPGSDECVVKDHRYHYVKCNTNDSYGYKCVVKPYDSGGFKRELCKDGFYYVAHPFRACVSKIIQDGDNESVARWTLDDSREICDKMGGYVVNNEYIHAASEFFRGNITHLKIHFVDKEIINDKNKNLSLNPDIDKWTPYHKTELYKQVMCAHKVDYRINLHIDSDGLVVDCNFDECTLENIQCFTDAETYIPTPVSIEDIASKSSFLNFLGNGYYWCRSIDDKYDESERILWIQNNSTLANTAFVLYRNEEMELVNQELDFVKKKIYRDNTTLYEIMNVSKLVGLTFEDPQIWKKLRERFPRALKISNPVFCESLHYTCDDNICGSFECRKDFNIGAKWMKIELPTAESEVSESMKQTSSGSELAEEVYSMNDLLRSGVRSMDKIDTIEKIDIIANTMKLEGRNRVNYSTSNLAAAVMDVNPGIVAIKVNTVQARKQADFITQDDLNGIKNNATDVLAFVEMNEMIRNRQIQRVTVLVIDDKTSNADPELILNSPIVHVSMPDEDDLKHYVDISFRPINQPVGDQFAVCASWNEERKSWSTDCCEAIMVDAVAGFQKCRCYRLSNFAQLLVNSDALKNADLYGLEIITYIGLTLSSFGLLVIGMTGVLFKEWRRDFGNKIWLNLSASILMMIMAFVLNAALVENPRKRPSLCLWLGVLMHYSILTTFFWMLVSAMLSYRKLVTVFDTGISHALFKASVFSWVGPGLIVGLLLLIDKKCYVRKTECSRSSPQNYCYPSGAGFWIAVFTPIIILLFLNLMFFLKILHNLFNGTTVDSHGGKDKYKQKVKVSILLFFLFGLTWFFGLMAKYVVMAYLFCIFATLQGFVMFIFFIIINKSARRLWSCKKTAYNVRRSSETGSKRPETDETEENINMIRERSMYTRNNSSTTSGE